MLQLTNPVVPGYSGGAVLNARGELIGVVQGELSPTEAGEAESSITGAAAPFVLPSEIVRPMLESLQTRGARTPRLPGREHARRERRERAARQRRSGSDRRAGRERSARVGPPRPAGLARGDLIVGFDRVRVEYPGLSSRAGWRVRRLPHHGRAGVGARRDRANRPRHAHAVGGRVPAWARAAPVARARSPRSRIADLERQIQQLNREVKRLKNGATASR